MSKRKKGNGGVYDLPVAKSAKEIPRNTRQLEEFKNYIDYIRPPYEPSDLLRIVEESDILKPLINALASNTTLFGYGIRYRQDFDYNKADKSIQQTADAEYDQLNTLYRYFNVQQQFSRVLYKAIYDKEAIGYGAIEILRNGVGEVCGGEYARACNFRIAVQRKQDRDATIKQMQINSDGDAEEVETVRRFRKFVQIVNGEKVYFKEFGDPRQMDCRTGEYSQQVETSHQATEILFLNNHCAYSDYGVPKWSGNIPNLVGNRKSEELNLVFFLQGKMMPFAITVSGGQLTDDSVEALKKGVGVDNAFKALLLEALPDENISGLDKDGNKVSVNIEHLTDTSLSDGLFMEYQKSNRDKVRGAFRLPPIYLGDSTDYTKATAEVSKLIAEEQVFVPEREEISDLFNSVICNELGIRYCEMYLKGPKMGDMAEVAAALQPFIAAGTVTPNMLLDTLGELLGKEIEATLPDEIGNTPIEILKLNMQQTGEQDIQKMAAVSNFDNMLSVLKNYLGDNDGY